MRRTKCKVCRGLLAPTMRKDVPRQEYLSDPFCSGTCARKFYGTELPETVTGGRKQGYTSRTHT